MSITHDQNFKNLILDYSREALAFFAPASAARLAPDVSIKPVRQEQLKARLGDRFHVLDVPLLVEADDGSHEPIIFLLEEESLPYRFKIRRLAIYCLSISEMFDDTTRVVPVVIFLKGSPGIARQLALGDGVHSFLNFDYIGCVLDEMRAADYMDSPNLVARLTLPAMRYAAHERLDVHASAVQALVQREPKDKARQRKYIDFINHYLPLTPAELQAYARRFPKEHTTMATWSEQLIEKGKQQGIQQGIQSGRHEALQEVMLQILEDPPFGEVDEATRERVLNASTVELQRWIRNSRHAGRLEDVFRLQ